MCRVLIICTDRFFAKKAKETSVIGDDIQIFIICADGTKKQNRGEFLISVFLSIAALPHRFSSIFSLIFYLKKPA